MIKYDWIIIMSVTQTRIIQYISKNPSTKACDLSRALGMTVANIRYHLLNLEKAQIIVSEIDMTSKHRGHPIYLYHMNSRVQPHNLDHLADILLNELNKVIKSVDKAWVPRILAENLIQNLESDFRLPPQKTKLTHRLSEVSRFLDQYHYHASWEAHLTSPHIILGNCPYLAILPQHPELCQMDILLLEKLILKPIHQISKIDQGIPRSINCVFALNSQTDGKAIILE